MAREVKVSDIHVCAFYDRRTGKDCTVEKVMDITDDCRMEKGCRCLLLYTRDSRQRLAQIQRPYEGEDFMGLQILFGVDTLDSQFQVEARDDTFGVWANDLGISKQQLRTIIKEYAPAI
jgi:hypothetical protein